MIKRKISNLSPKRKQKVKQWCWFFGLYLGGILLLAGFSELVHILLPQAS